MYDASSRCYGFLTRLINGEMPNPIILDLLRYSGIGIVLVVGGTTVGNPIDIVLMPNVLEIPC